MPNFIDLQGASGAEYRFRVWPDGAVHQPVAGNYVIVKAEAEGLVVLLVGVTNDLSRARDDWSKVAKRGATHIYTRLNVPRATRAADHADLIAAHKSARVSEAA